MLNQTFIFYYLAHVGFDDDEKQLNNNNSNAVDDSYRSFKAGDNIHDGSGDKHSDVDDSKGI